MAGVPAGRLSIEIVAEIARLQQDMDKAKRAVREASGDIARSATHANDNLARMGTTMNTVGTTSRAMRASFINLGRQVQDVGTMFALGAPPMQIFASQGAQIVDVLAMMSAEAKASNTSLTRMAAGGLARLGPYALAAAAAGGTLALVLNDITDEINENSRVTVTWGDVLLGTFDAVTSAAGGALTSAFRSLGIDVGGVFDFIATAARAKANEIIGHYVFAVNAIKAAWRTFPGAVVEFVIDAVNGALQAIERLINGGIAMLNTFVTTVNSVVGSNLSTIAEVNFGELENTYRGAGAAAGAAMAEAQGASYRDYLGDFADFVAPFAEARAVKRLEGAAAESGTRAGRAMGQAAGREVQEAIEDALKAAALEAQEIADKIAAGEDRLRDKLKAEAEIRNRAQEDADEEARRLEDDRIRDMASLYETLFTDGVDGVWATFKKQGLAAISQIAAQWTLSLLSGQSGASNNPLSSVMGLLGGSGAANDNGLAGAAVDGLKSILGLGGTTGRAGAAGGTGATSVAATLAAIPGLGEALAVAGITAGIGEGIEKLTGLRFDMLGGLAGGLIGGFAVGAIKGAVKGNATIGGSGSTLSIVDSFGKKKFREQAETDAGGVMETLARLADGLGIDLNASAGSVSIGTRNGKYRVDPLGGGALSTKKGAIDFGKDSQAAIEYAIRDLIEDGVLGGISQAAKNLLGAGGDLEKAIEKAMLIESVPKLLKQRLDPLGYALDEIDDKFRTLNEALKEGGGTAQQFAEAEKLYNLERSEAISQIGSAAQTLIDFAASLAYGSNSPLSVRSQLASARSALSGLDPTKDQDKYVTAAQAVLALSRQANGSSGAYFSDYNAINGNIQQAIGTLESQSSVPGEGLVFQQQTATATTSIARMMEDQNALLREQNELLRGANDNGSKKGDKFIGSKRGFGS